MTMAKYIVLLLCATFGCSVYANVEAEVECSGVMDIKQMAYMDIVHTLTNGSESLDVEALEHLVEDVEEAAGCEEHECMCLNATQLLEQSPGHMDALFLSLLRYMYDTASTCQAIEMLGEEATTLEFSHGFFASVSDVEVAMRVLANIARASAHGHEEDESHEHSEEHDESHEHSDEDDHEDEDGHGHDHDHEEDHEGEHEDEHDSHEEGVTHATVEGVTEETEHDSHEDGEDGHVHSDEEGEGDSHHSDEEEGHDHSGEMFVHYHHGCPHIECFDTQVGVAILREFGVEGQDAKALMALLITQHLVHGGQFAVDCGSDDDIHLDELPTEADFIVDTFERLGAASTDAINFAEFEMLLSDLAIGGTSHSSHEEGGDAHDHRRRRKRDAHTLTQCYSAEELYQAYGIHPSLNMNGDQFSTICPSLVQQLVSGNCAEEDEHDEGDEVTDAEIYGYGTLAVFIICCASLPGVFLYPIVQKKDTCWRFVMSLMIGLAIGSLAGDAILHLFPEAFGLHDHDGDGHDHEDEKGPNFEDPTQKGLAALGAILAFFLLESVMSAIVRMFKEKDQETSEASGKYLVEDDVPGKDEDTSNSCGSILKRVKMVAWMVIIGDALHNFVDGLAIAAAFSHSVPSGISTSIAVFCHEVPHELGDFAVLVNSGFSVGQAAAMNFLSACSCFAGLYVGIPISVSDEARYWIFIITAGMFLYIALGDMVPEAHDLQNGKWSGLIIIFQVIGILIGISILLVIALYETDLHSIVE